MDFSMKQARKTVCAEPHNAVAVGAVSLYASPTLTKAKDTKAFAIVSSVDTSIGIAGRLSSDARLALTQYASAAGAEPDDAFALIACAIPLYASPALTKAEDTKAFAIISSVDTRVGVAGGLADNTVVPRVCSK
jgi:hypothetical protein